MQYNQFQSVHAEVNPPGSILVIGEALVDCFPDMRVAGGAPFNLARNLGAFGAAPVMITRIGKDDSGELLRAECRRFNLSQEGVQCDATLPTGHVDVVAGGSGHAFVIADNVAWDAIDPLRAAEVTRRTQPTIVCFGTLAQRAPESRAAIVGVLEHAHQGKALRVLDLNLRSGAASAAIADIVEIAEWSLCHADIVKVNEDELAQLVEWFVPAAAAGAGEWGSAGQLHAVGQLLHRFSLRNLIVTRGVQGYTAFDSDGKPVASGAAAATQIIDTVGAGDAFTSVVVLGEWLGWTFGVALARANHFAAAVCSLRGAVVADPDFYRPWAEQWRLQLADLRAGAQT